MKTVQVSASKTYAVKIGAGLLTQCGEEIAALGGTKRVCIVSDNTVWPLYGEKVQASLEKAGFLVDSFVFAAGESSKNGSVYLALLSRLAQIPLTRTDTVVALGGGVAGDLAGFTAATYLRGVRFVQLPTTLLAAVDSSVGGKTAIDLPEGKNLAGAFYQPELVLCDCYALQTLPSEIFRAGCAEVIKYAVLFDPALFDYLLETGTDFDLEYVIAKCVQWKQDIVAADEFEKGQRKLLNLGHTFGHGIEACSNFEISHGEAVAAGMAIAARVSASMELCDSAVVERIEEILKRFSLPVSADLSAKALCKAALQDKKRAGDCIHLILPKAIGDCRMVEAQVADLEKLIAAGL